MMSKINGNDKRTILLTLEEAREIYGMAVDAMDENNDGKISVDEFNRNIDKANSTISQFFVDHCMGTISGEEMMDKGLSEYTICYAAIKFAIRSPDDLRILRNIIHSNDGKCRSILWSQVKGFRKNSARKLKKLKSKGIRDRKRLLYSSAYHSKRLAQMGLEIEGDKRIRDANVILKQMERRWSAYWKSNFFKIGSAEGRDADRKKIIKYLTKRCPKDDWEIARRNKKFISTIPLDQQKLFEKLTDRQLEDLYAGALVMGFMKGEPHVAHIAKSL